MAYRSLLNPQKTSFLAKQRYREVLTDIAALI